jgi:hypothetical protein
MKLKSQRDFWSGLLFVLIGLACAWAATGHDFGTSAEPGPGYLPFGLGLLLAFFGGLVLFKSLAIESEGNDPVGFVAWRPLLLIIGAIVFFGYGLPRLGLVCTVPVLVLTALLAAGKVRWPRALVSVVMLTAGAWALLVYGLKLAVPLWPALPGI